MAIAAWVHLEQWALALSARGKDISDLIGPMSDFSVFAAGSLFAIYFLGVSRGDGFLGRIFHTETFRKFHRYVALALMLTTVLFFWTAKLTVIGVGDIAHFLPHMEIAAWLGFAVWSFVCVARVVVIFMIMVNVRLAPPPGKTLGQVH
ncbi:MAG: hypothetical protein GYB53_24095 [Rhodobacteraceae bacterium]|nr:hypothetical protein [Paracoccaceae bacterium]MBR9822502.1 hypothetical protein [Paracoccaceae bacterium]